VAAEVRDRGGDALLVMGDVGDSAEVARMAAEALDHFGTVHVLANNAAIRPDCSFLEMTDADWRRVLAVDLDAAFYFSRAFLPGMVAAGWGRVVNFTGMNAMHGHAGKVHVSVAKHGVWGLTKALAKEFGAKGVTVNAISPGPIRQDDDETKLGQAKAMAARLPLGRMGHAHEIAALVGYLVSEEGGFATGQMIAVNGGGQT
jgi:3-oxoacyl-[acyl-carrier protein] reductase